MMKKQFTRLMTIMVTLALLLNMPLLPVMAEGTAWDCPNCGREGNTENFCPNCGQARPVTDWTCPNCGREGNTENFCPNCGQARTEMHTIQPTPTPESRAENADEDSLLQQGIAAYDAKEYDTAFQILKLLADQGNAEAQWRVSDMYFHGNGVEKDDAAAFEYALLSAEQSNSFGQSQLGFMYLYGIGIKRDDTQAFQYFRLSAEQGNESGLYHLSDYGLLTEIVDCEKALLYYEMALELADESSDNYSYFLENVERIKQKIEATTLTPSPTPTSSKDIPDLTEIVKLPLVLGEKGQQAATDYDSSYIFYTYDYYEGILTVSDIQAYLDLLEKDYHFRLVDHKVATPMGNRREEFYFRYTGSKSVSALKVGDKKNYGSTYNLLVRIFVPAQGHNSISIRFSPELSYAGSYAKEGQWFTGGGGSTPIPSDGPVPIPTPTPTPYKPITKCPKCHGDGKITCSQCDGSGGKYIYDNSTHSNGKTWENCFKCKGEGKLDCTYCGGDGWIND